MSDGVEKPADFCAELCDTCGVHLFCYFLLPTTPADFVDDGWVKQARLDILKQCRLQFVAADQAVIGAIRPLM